MLAAIGVERRLSDTGGQLFEGDVADQQLAGGDTAARHEAAWALGAANGVNDLEALQYANTICNEQGFDPISFGATIGAVMELYEMGVLTKEQLGIDANSYLVIVTRGHLHDLEVLEQALRTPAGYIGMIGSRKKRNSIYTRLLDRGVTEAQLEQVRCPIGMAIEADTPEEIAVSIVGELIYQRATGRKAWHLA